MGTIVFKTDALIQDNNAKVFGKTNVYYKCTTDTVKRLRFALSAYEGKSFHVTFAVPVTLQYAPSESGILIAANTPIEINTSCYISVTSFSSNYDVVEFLECFNVKSFLYAGFNSTDVTSNTAVFSSSIFVKLSLLDFLNLSELGTYYSPSPLMENTERGSDSILVDLRNFKFCRVDTLTINLNSANNVGYYVANPNTENDIYCQFVSAVNLGPDSLNARFRYLWFQGGNTGNVDVNLCPNFKVKTIPSNTFSSSCNILMNLLYHIEEPLIEGANVTLNNVTDTTLLTTDVVNSVVAKFASVNGHFTLNNEPKI